MPRWARCDFPSLIANKVRPFWTFIQSITFVFMIDLLYLKTMTIQELKYLVAVAEHLHFGRAASACHVTQPTLSAGLRSLENKLDLMLFERGPHGVLITSESGPLVEQARRVLAEARQFEQLARAGQSPLAGVFRLGAIPTIGPYLFPHIIASLRKDWPQLQLSLVEAQTDDLLQQLRRGDLDAALLSPPIDETGLEREHLYEEDFLLALPAGHPLQRKRTLRVTDLADEQLLLLDEGHCLRDQVVEFCRVGEASARDLLRSSSLETLRNMVTAGAGCTLLPALAVNDSSGDIRPLSRPTPSREVVLYWREKFAGAESARLLADTIRDHLPARVKPGR